MNTYKAVKLSKQYITVLKKNGINTPLRLAHFFAQLDHESGLIPVAENLNYSAQGLLKTFRKYFSSQNAANYARNPERIANRVYANRMGNGNEMSGDGWRYRGRGFIQITGKNNYASLSKDTSVDYVLKPDLLLNEADSILSALWYWRVNRLNRFSDADDINGLTRAINGGLNGLSDRKRKLDRYKLIFK